MSDIVNVSRRRLLQAGALAGGGLILGVRIPLAAAAQDGAAGTFVPNAFVRIGADESVTVVVPHSEMGQGAYTSVAMMVAEDLEADWTRVRAVPAPVDPAYNHTVFGIQMTGGSTSTTSEWERLRRAGAAARVMLVAAAAQQWKADPSECRAESGTVVHAATRRTLTYGALVGAASKLEPPKDVALKDPKDFRIVGKSLMRLDTPEKVNGSAVFGIDVARPGLLVALVERSPVFGGKLKSFDAEKAKAVPGVRHVVRIDRGVAVVADGFWPAKLGREALTTSWDEGPLAALDTRAQGEEYARMAGEAGAVARREGEAAKAFAGAAKKVEAVYDLPYLAHAAMEPLNCVADVREDACEVWIGTQFQTGDRDAAAQEAGLKPERVTLHTTLLGGGFGRRAVIDSHMVREAVQISKAVKAPVKVIWTREDDTRGGYYRPRAYHTMKAAVDAAGNPVSWEHHIVCQSFMAGTPFEPFLVKDGVDATAVEGAAADMYYDVPNVHVAYHQAPAGVPTLWWRSVGHSHTAFVVETMIDELAHAAGKDPLAFRVGLLAKHPRVAKVLELAAQKAGWGKPVAEGRGRGLAVHESFGSIIAHVAEASVGKDGRPRVHRFTSAIDCGSVVNPDMVAAQIESGIVFGLTAALYGEITFEKGRVKQRNFHDYPMLRMHEMPEVEVVVAPSGAKMGGVGEPGVPPVAPALANALFAATGRRVRRLPVRAEDLRRG